MPKVAKNVLRAKDENGIWNDVPAIVSVQSLIAAQEAQNSANLAQQYADEVADTAHTIRGWTREAVGEWLDDHPEATTTVDFSVVEKIFNNVQDMCEDITLEAGVICATKGYYNPNDGGGASYIILDAQPSGFYESIDGGLYAQLLLGDTCNVKQFGAKGDGTTDDTTALNNAALYGAETIFFPKGVYSTEGINCRFSDKTFIGYGATLKSNVVTKRVNRYSLLSNYPQGRTWTSENSEFTGYVNIFGLTLDGNKDIYDTEDPDNMPMGTTGAGISLALFERVVIKDCIVKDTVMAGIITRACNKVLVDNCELYGISLAVDKEGSTAFIWDAILASSGILVDGQTVRKICEKCVVQNCKIYGSLSGGISSFALYTTICNNYIEDNGGYSTEDGFITSTEEPSVTGYVFVRNIINNVYNRVNLQVYHNNDRFRGNDLIVNFEGNKIYGLGGAPEHPPASSASIMKNGFFGCVVTPELTKADITIKNNLIVTENTSPYSAGILFDIVGASSLEICDNVMLLSSALFKTSSNCLSKDFRFNRNVVKCYDNVTSGIALLKFATDDYIVTMDNMEIIDNIIDWNYTGSSPGVTGVTLFNSTPSSIKNRINNCVIKGNRHTGNLERFVTAIGGSYEKLLVCDNVVDADVLFANRSITTAEKGFVKGNVCGTSVVLDPAKITITSGAIADNYPDQS